MAICVKEPAKKYKNFREPVLTSLITGLDFRILSQLTYHQSQ